MTSGTPVLRAVAGGLAIRTHWWVPVWLLLASAPIAGAQTPSPAPPGSEPPTASPTGTDAPTKTAPDFTECENVVSEDDLREQVTAGARAAMRSAATSVDYESLVAQSWSSINFDTKFARIVDAQIDVLRQDRAYYERLLDGNIPSRAEEMAQKAADAVFGSPEFAQLQGELQIEIGKQMQPLVSGADLNARTRAAECVRVFLGRRYAATVSAAFGAEAKNATLDPEFPTAKAKVSAALSLAGVVAAMLTIVFRRLVRRIVTAIVRRLAGAIAARLLAWASIVLGVVVLVYELIAGADGVFPLIRDELTGPETRTMIQRSLVEELSTVAPEQLDDRAAEIGSQMIDRWRRFKANHRSVLDLARRNEAFRKFIEDYPPEEFERLSTVVQAIKAMPPGGDRQVLDALERGLLARALALPSVDRLIDTWAPLGVTVFDLVEWKDRAKGRFEDTLAARLPAIVKPDTLSDETLDRILALDNNKAAGRVAAMAEPARSEALALDPDLLVGLAMQFDGPQLTRLFTTVSEIDAPTERTAVLRAVRKNPRLIGRLESAASAVAASAQPTTAVEILLSDNSIWAWTKVIEHFNAVADGKVAPSILAHRYGWGLALVLGIPALVALLLLRRLGQLLGLVGRRR